MIEGPTPGNETAKQKYVYDAWNRLVKVTDASDVELGAYEYDGLGRRIVRTDKAADPDVVYDSYYNEAWQELEVRKDSDTDPLEQFVWHPYYIDALAVRYYDGDTDGASVAEEYLTQDANMNVTALLDSAGAVQERYEYRVYGELVVLDADFSADADGKSDVENAYTYTGRRFDPESGLYYYRARYYHGTLGRFLARDPIGYKSDRNLYAYVRGKPCRRVDPSGNASCEPRFDEAFPTTPAPLRDPPPDTEDDDVGIAGAPPLFIDDVSVDFRGVASNSGAAVTVSSELWFNDPRPGGPFSGGYLAADVSVYFQPFCEVRDLGAGDFACDAKIRRLYARARYTAELYNLEVETKNRNRAGNIDETRTSGSIRFGTFAFYEPNPFSHIEAISDISATASAFADRISFDATASGNPNDWFGRPFARGWRWHFEWVCRKRL